MTSAKIPIAIYDMDKTVTRHPSFTPFLLYAARTHETWRLILVPFVAVTIFAYLLGLIDRGRLKTLNHRLMIGPRIPRDTAATLAQGFAARIVATDILPKARDRIARDRAEGRRIVLATASYAFYADPIGTALGFDDIVATRCATDGQGALLARIDGENCYGPAKLRMIEAWMANAGLARDACHIRFYSDHVSDAPTFAWADEPIAVNAHGPLSALAAAQRWVSEDWR